MKLTFVLRDKKNALKLSTKSIENFIERIKTDTKDAAVARRRRQLSYGDYTHGYDRQFPTHVIYPSAVFEKDDNDNLRMKAFNGVVALTIDGLENQEIDAVKRAAMNDSTLYPCRLYRPFRSRGHHPRQDCKSGEYRFVNKWHFFRHKWHLF